VHERGWALLGDTGVVVARSRLPLVGRRRELQFIRDRLELARAGRPQGVVISGPAGIGKSRLAREVRARAREDGFQDVHVTTINGDGVAFGPLAHQLVPLLIEAFGADEAYRADVGVLETLASTRERADLEAGFGRDALPTEESAESLERMAEVPVAVVDDERIAEWIDHHRHDLVQRLLTLTRLTIEAAQRSPMVLVVDDLHLVDGATLVFVDQLLVTAERVARHEDVPLLVLALARSADPGEVDIAEQLARLPMCDALPLAGIERLEALDLLAALGVDAQGPGAETLVRASGGSPLFLESVSRHLLSAGADSSVTTLSGVPLPETVFEAVASGLEELDPGTRAVLADAALLGDVVPVELLVFVTGRDEDELATLLEPAAAEGLVERRGATVRFTHALRRLAAASGRSDVARQQRHLEIANLLVERPPGVLPDLGALAVAHHLVEAGHRAPADLLARYAERAAAECNATGNWHEAARFSDVAADAAEAQEPALPVAQVGAYHLGASRAWVAALDMDRAMEHAERAAALFEEVHDPRWAEAVLLRYRCLVYQARFGLWVPAGDDLRRLMDDPGGLGPAAVEALVTASELAWIRGDIEEAAQLADTAHQQAVAGGFDPQAAAGLVSRATAAWLELDLHGADRLLAEAQRLAGRAGDGIGSAVSSGRAAFTRWLLGDVAEAEELSRAALTWSEDAGRQLERTMPLAVLTAIGVARGDRSSAELRADEALLLQRASGDWWTAPFVSGPLAYAAVLAGDRTELVTQLRMLRDGLGGEPGRAVSRAIGLWARAVQGAERPTDRAAVAAMDDDLVRAEFPGPRVGVAALCAAYVDTADLLGVRVPMIVVERLHQAEERGQVMASTLPMLIPRVLATVSRLAGDLEEAEARARGALELAERLGLTTEVARAHLELARTLAQRGDAGAPAQAAQFAQVAEELRLTGLLELAHRLPDVTLAPGGQTGRTDLGAGGLPVAVVVDLATRSWMGDRVPGSAYQQVRRQVLQAAAHQVEAFGGQVAPGDDDVVVAWFPSLRLAVEFAFRAVARSRRRGAAVGVGVELAGRSVTNAEAVAVARGLAQLAGADEVLVTGRAREASERAPGIEYRHHSTGRVEGAPDALQIVRARLLRNEPPA
jgi:hypothetical protein